jgi:hypothetical protein
MSEEKATFTFTFALEQCPCGTESGMIFSEDEREYLKSICENIHNETLCVEVITVKNNVVND